MNKAYCEVVNLMFVKELRKATNATEAIPAEILSAIITIIRYSDFGSNIVSIANKILVLAASIAPTNKTK